MIESLQDLNIHWLKGKRKVAVSGENDEKASTEIGKKRKGVKRDVSADKK